MERNEHPVKTEMEGIQKSSIYWHCCLKKKKKKTVVPVPLLLVPVPAKQNPAVPS